MAWSKVGARLIQLHPKYQATPAAAAAAAEMESKLNGDAKSADTQTNHQILQQFIVSKQGNKQTMRTPPPGSLNDLAETIKSYRKLAMARRDAADILNHYSESEVISRL